jgi:hypothetical protein
LTIFPYKKILGGDGQTPLSLFLTFFPLSPLRAKKKKKREEQIILAAKISQSYGDGHRFPPRRCFFSHILQKLVFFLDSSVVTETQIPTVISQPCKESPNFSCPLQFFHVRPEDVVSRRGIRHQ